MKMFLLSALVLSSFASFASSNFVESAFCFNRADTKSFKVLIPEESNFYEGLKAGVDEIVVDSKGETHGKIIKNNGAIVTIGLKDGRTLKFNQNGGYKTTLGNESYICSNALGF